MPALNPPAKDLGKRLYSGCMPWYGIHIGREPGEGIEMAEMVVFAEARDGAWSYADVEVAGGPLAAVVSWKGEPIVTMIADGEASVLASWKYGDADWRVEQWPADEIAVQVDMTLNALWGEGMRRRK